jgi:hypothetical protein
MYPRLRPTFSTALACAFLQMVPLSSQAEQPLEWNGFLNAVGGFSRNENATLQDPEGTFTNGFGYGEDVTFDHETSAGLQASKALNDETEVTTQIFARGSDENYQAKMKWLYLTWQGDEHSRFRVGRIATPTYYFSDYINVGYAYHWISPPQWVYLFDTTSTGIDYAFEDTWKDVAWSFELFYGSNDEYLPTLETDFQSKNSRGFVLSFSKDEWLSGRLASFWGTASWQFRNVTAGSLVDRGFDTLLASGELPAEQVELLRTNFSAGIEPFVEDILLLEDEPLRFSDFALRADKDSWFAMYEMTRFGTDTYFFNSSDAWFLTGGVRTGRVLWHLTYADITVELHEDAKRDEAIVNAGPAGMDPAALSAFLGRAFKVGAAYAYANEFREWTLGSAIELTTSTLLKFEATYSHQLPMGDRDTSAVGYNTLFKAALNVSF